jgi:UDP-N-acetylmuramoyl-tripeptide--D-alanyl-D-alanine ligase
VKQIFKKIITFILLALAKAVILKYKPKIIAITGSVGKTSTKDAVYTVLSRFDHVRKSEKSYNSQIGLPLTILGLPNGWNNPLIWLGNIFKGMWLLVGRHKYPRWLVLEVGVGKPGDMAETASWLRTDVVVITAIGDTPVHIEFFKSKKHLIEEKSGLIDTLKKDGVLVLNKDDEDVMSMKEKTRNITVTYGFDKEADLVGSATSISYGEDKKPEGIVYRVDEEGRSLPVSIKGGCGQNHVYASLAALAVARALNLNIIDAIEHVSELEVPPGRMKLLEGINETLILDDTYNSSPFACKSAVKSLGAIELQESGRKIAVLGDMLELGKHTEEEHEKIGELVKGNADFLVTVGLRAKKIKEGAVAKGMRVRKTKEFNDSREAGEFLTSFIEPGDIILVKGSQGMRMERAVEMILEDKEHQKDLLVRQNKEWLDKE